MSVQLKEIIKSLEQWAPKSDAEDFDNVGLQVGDPNVWVKKALITLDITENVIQEAIDKDAQLVITFHPLIFKGLKKLSGNGRIERTLVKAIQHDIAIYAIHTNLDAQLDGVNGKISDKLGLINRGILIPKENDLFKLIFFVPKDDAENVKNKIFETGAGTIGNYAECSFNQEGIGTFKPIKNAQPTVGEISQRHYEPETKVEILLRKNQIHATIQAMKKVHPYEEVAYDLIPLENKNQNKGMGQIGELEKPISEEEFLKKLKDTFNLKSIRHSQLLNKTIKKIAVLGGSGAFAIPHAIQQNADVLVTADLKYHDFFLAEDKILLCDIGHYESEQFTKNLIKDYLSENFANFAVLIADINTNPVNYFI